MMSSDGFVPMQNRVFHSTQELNVDNPSMSKSSISGADSEPRIPPDSPGSSVSSRLQEEYDELLKFAVVIPVTPGITSYGLGRSWGGGDNRMQGATLLHTNLADQQTLPNLVDLTPTLPGGLPASDQKVEPERKPSTTSLQHKAKADVVDASLPTSHETTLESERNVDAVKKLNVVPFDLSSNDDEPVAIDVVQHQYGKRTSQRDVLRDHMDSDQDEDNGHNDAAMTYTYTATVDQDMSRMDNLLDQWTSDLKRNIMGEFGQAKIRLIEQHRQQILQERQRHAGEGNQLQNQIEELRELLTTYEQSIQRKDQVISNLTAGLQHHRNRMEVQRTFSEWKIRHNDTKREAFASNLARKHHQRTLQQKVWSAWHSLVEARWRQRVEKACQAKAQEVCIGLTNDYETKLASLNEALDAARQEVCRLHAERDRYEETMKKAFMRGVCALNLEAMTMFHDPSDDKEPSQGRAGTEREGNGRGMDHGCGEMHDVGQHSRPVTIAQEYVYHTEPTSTSSARVVTGQLPSNAAPTSRITDVTRSKTAGRGAKVITARITASNDVKRTSPSVIGGQTLAPPMPSVVVERHQPVAKQTIGQATAAKYPQQRISTPPAVVQRKIAGQAGVNIPMTNIQTIRVVE